METSRMGQLYQEIAEKLNEIIPVNWKEIHLYAEVIYEDSTMVYFYFNTHEMDKYTYYYYIPKNFNVDKSIFNKMMDELYKKIEELHLEFKDNNPEMWTNLTLKLESSGKFNISYDYEDVLSSELTNIERRMIFVYKNLGTLPEDENDRKFLEDYLKNHS
ncbi:immunity protein YezG family protein [Paenibacillus sp. L3-i20]|uniref:immunity protein YezG family protein n=1 Tax=Paenibacillus sp. L3-i20 TaxID=2905833 RepID=UPI001EDD9214|nr:immunity protein YezG family protein [Paenibacillus sp. L3-i20]GKU78140.1 putative antitoxin YezG [Paenibacillus sp. L3-i20]